VEFHNLYSLSNIIRVIT